MSFQLPRQFDIEVARGEVTGYESSALIGQNPSVGTSFEDIWDVGGDFVYPTSGETWEVVSDNAADTSAGTGARIVLISGLDDSFVEQTETVTMNGTTPVVTVRTDWFRINNVFVISSGSGQVNAGTIDIRISGGGTIRSRIRSGRGRTLNGFFTVPAGKTLFGEQLQVIVPKNQDIIMQCRTLIFGTNTFVLGAPLPLYQNNTITTFKALPTLPEKTDLRFTASSKNETSSVQIFVESKIVKGTLSAGASQVRSF